MARQKLVALVISAVCLAFFAIVTVKGMAARERRSFEASRALLEAGAQLVTSELASAGHDLPETAEHMAVDLELGTQLHLLSQQMTNLAAMPRPGERMKQLVLAQTTKVNDHLSTLRGDLARGHEVDSVALLDEQGLVLLSDSQVLPIGNRVRLPGATPPPAPAPAPAPPPPTEEGAEAAPAPPAPAAAPTMDDAQTETVRAAAAGAPALGALVLDGAIIHVGAAPIYVKAKLAGIIVVERRLRTLPKPTGVDPVLSLDGQVRMGRPPEGASVDSNAGEAAFLLAAREVKSFVPGIGSVGVGPLFVAPGTVGVWARRFEVARVPQAVGYVYTDVTPAFAELGGLQVMTVILAAVAFLIHAALIATTGIGMSRGVNAMADFLSKQQQGLGDGTRLSERTLPAGLHRLARLVNKSLDKGASGSASIVSARNASLDDVIAHHEPTPAPDVSELDFGSFASAAPAAPAANVSGFKAATVEMRRPVMPAEAKPPVAESRAPIADSRASIADTRPPPSPALADPGSAALLASLEELSDSLGSGSDDGFSDGPSFAPEAPKPAPKPNGATGPAAPVSKAGPAPKPSPSDTPRDVHYREVYQRFVEVRLECREPTDDLTYDKFTAKLAQSRDAVMSKHACQDVRFQVYVKNGKAALKATPVK